MGKTFPTFIVPALVLALGVPPPARGFGGPGNDRGYALENGDINGDSKRDLSDAVALLSHLFLGGPAPDPLAWCGGTPPAIKNGDINGNKKVDLTDAVLLIQGLLLGRPKPVAPCGTDIRIVPPGAIAYGRSHAEWFAAYWPWQLNGQKSALGQVGIVTYMPIPSGDVISGSFTPDDPALIRGHLDVTIPRGNAIVMPFWAWIAERYDPTLGIPDDPQLPASFVDSSVAQQGITLNGVSIVNKFKDFYDPATIFNPLVVYEEPRSYGAVGAISFSGAGVIIAPLKPGVHTLALNERYVVDGVAGIAPFGVLYENSWTITVP